MAIATANREAFKTSRRLEFLSVGELEKQAGYRQSQWPEMIMKELIDNAVDACEEARVAPQISVDLSEGGIVVADNGPGIPAATVAGIVDLDERVSSRQAYMAPDRGAQGNATKVLVGIPFALRPDAPGALVIESHGQRHEIAVSVDGLSENPAVSLRTTSGDVKTGTRVEVQLPCSQSDQDSPFLQDDPATLSRLLAYCLAYCSFNPHLAIELRWPGDAGPVNRTAADWRKWRPCDPTSVHWYSGEKFAALVKRCMARDMADSRDRPVSEFVQLFDGMSGSRVRKAVLDECGLSRRPLSSLAPDGEPDGLAIEQLREAIAQRARTVPAKRLGLIGKDHLLRAAIADGADESTFRYAKVLHDDDLPGVTEVAFAVKDESDSMTGVFGVNWSAAINNPFRLPTRGGYDSSLDLILGRWFIDEDSPVFLAVHHSQVGARYTDRGKGSLSLPAAAAERIAKAVEKVTAAWVRQRKAEERDRKARLRRQDAVRREKETKRSIKDIAYEIMPAVYEELSRDGKGGRLPVNARQFMYRARPMLLELSGKSKFSDSYFTQQLLPDFIAENPETAGDWDVVYDDRGHFTEPHTGQKVGLGTLDVRRYVADCRPQRGGLPHVTVSSVREFPTHGPINRYGAVLFIEKEGFAPLFKSVRLADRFDIAIMSTKGLSNVAARNLVDEVCCPREGDPLPLFVLHDFDKAGFSILGTLQRSSRRYKFRNQIEVIDLGVRLKDVQRWGLQSEPVVLSRGKVDRNVDPRDNLRENGATQEEIDFLVSKEVNYHTHRTMGVEYRGQRVELNAFSPRDFVAWIEESLTAHGVKKVVPTAEALAQQYQRAAAYRRLCQQLIELEKQISMSDPNECEVPTDLREQVKALLEEKPALAWDAAVMEIATADSRDR